MSGGGPSDVLPSLEPPSEGAMDSVYSRRDRQHVAGVNHWIFQEAQSAEKYHVAAGAGDGGVHRLGSADGVARLVGGLCAAWAQHRSAVLHDGHFLYTEVPS